MERDWAGIKDRSASGRLIGQPLVKSRRGRGATCQFPSAGINATIVRSSKYGSALSQPAYHPGLCGSSKLRAVSSRPFKRKTKMHRVNHVGATLSNHSRRALQVPIQICSDGARPADMAHNTLYVLGFGLAGTILANALILVFFTSSWAPT